MMDTSNPKENAAAHLVCALLGLPVDSVKLRGALNASQAEPPRDAIVAFALTTEVIQETRQYLERLQLMWNRSRSGQELSDPKVLFPDFSEDRRRDAASRQDLLTHSPHGDITSSMPSPPPTREGSGATNLPGGSSTGTYPRPNPAPVPPPSRQPAGSSALDTSLRPGQVSPRSNKPGTPVTPSATFQLPNANVGQTYRGKLEAKGPNGQPVSIIEVSLPPDAGLSFDLQTSEVTGAPTVAGDYNFAVRWKAESGAVYMGEGLLTVNANPRDLWKKFEPPADDIYFKKNTDEELIEASGFRIAAASRRGRSHEHVGSFRDDDFFIKHDAGSGWAVVIVADGAGGSKSSRYGSKLAVKHFGQHVVSNLNGEVGLTLCQALGADESARAAAGKIVGDLFLNLFRDAGSLAVQAIEAEANAKGAAVKDYSTTLLAAAVRRTEIDTFVATFWMGDGAIASYGLAGGSVKVMGTPDGGEFAGQTRFLDKAALSDQSFSKRIRCERFAHLPAILLMTDGVSDPRFETDNGLVDPAKWDALWAELGPSLASQEPHKALTDWLDFFSPGHHDDRTIAVLW